MSFLTIEANGDYFLDTTLGADARQSPATTVMILENLEDATTLFGMGDILNKFKAFPNGDISVGNVINHGKGCRLMVRVSGLISGNVVIRLMMH